MPKPVVDDRVLLRSVRVEVVNWWPGEVTRVRSSSTYLVYVRNTVRFVHADHLRPSNIEPVADVELPRACDVTDTTPTTDQSPESSSPAMTPLRPGNHEQTLLLRRSTRKRRPPDR